MDEGPYHKECGALVLGYPGSCLDPTISCVTWASYSFSLCLCFLKEEDNTYFIRL